MNQSIMSVPQNQRLKALDVMRGITIAGMILVNNAGSATKYAPLEHANWNGLTPTDLVFPFFMFIMGVSTYFSLRRYNFQLTKDALIKILRRGIVIFLIGMFIAWLGMFLSGMVWNGKTFAEAALNFNQIRILGVLPRLAICYAVGAILALVIKRKWLPWVIGITLFVYAIVIIVGEGYEICSRNVLYQVDVTILGENHMYKGIQSDGINSLQFEPEGILSTLPSIAHMLIGFMCGYLIVKYKEDNYKRISQLFIVGTILTFAGLLLSYGIPINKKIWSPTFVLTTCGMASLLLGLLIYIVDIRGKKRWCRFFEVFGINPLFLYVLSALVSIVMGNIIVGELSLKKYTYFNLLVPVSPDEYIASLLYALLNVAFCWVIGTILYKRKIYIKI